ncbi:hypothetical protein ACCS53_38855, partial [Rhizobium ruizarguesonis]
FRRDFFRALSSSNPIVRVIERMMIIILIAFVGVFLFAGASDIHERWLDPFLLFLPIYLFLKLEIVGSSAVSPRQMTSTGPF